MPIRPNLPSRMPPLPPRMDGHPLPTRTRHRRASLLAVLLSPSPRHGWGHEAAACLNATSSQRRFPNPSSNLTIPCHSVVYDEVATSPLYEYKSAFAIGDIEHTEGNDEIYSVLSLVFWTLTLITLLKYVLIIHCAANDSEGGTFTLYSLLCRRFHTWLLPSGGDDLKEQHGGAASAQASSVHAVLQQWKGLQWLLLLFVLLGTSMVIGDGVLTLALSGRIDFLRSLMCDSCALCSVISSFRDQIVHGQ